MGRHAMAIPARQQAFRRRGRRAVAVLTALLIPVASAVAFASVASADTGSAELWIKGQGSLYTNRSNTVVLNAPATFSVEVVNTGESLAQFRVQYGVDNGGFVGTIAGSLFSGSTNVSALADDDQDGPGYWTTPIAPGKAAVLSLKMSSPSPADPSAYAYATVDLFNSDGDQVDTISAEATVKQSSGGMSSAGLFASSGSDAVSGNNGFGGQLSAVAQKVGGKAVYTLHLYNHATTPEPEEITVAPNFFATPEIAPLPDECAQDVSAFPFPTVLKAGTVDITQVAFVDGGYETTLKAGGSLTLTLTVTYPGPGVNGCTESAVGVGVSSNDDNGNITAITVGQAIQ